MSEPRKHRSTLHMIIFTDDLLLFGDQNLQHPLSDHDPHQNHNMYVLLSVRSSESFDEMDITHAPLVIEGVLSRSRSTQFCTSPALSLKFSETDRDSVPSFAAPNRLLYHLAVASIQNLA